MYVCCFYTATLLTNFGQKKIFRGHESSFFKKDQAYFYGFQYTIKKLDFFIFRHGFICTHEEIQCIVQAGFFY